MNQIYRNRVTYSVGSPLGKPIDQQKTLSVKKKHKPMIVQSRISLTKSSHLYIYIVRVFT